MKRTITFIIITLFSFILIACDNNEKPIDLFDEVFNSVEIGYKDNDNSNNVTNDLTLSLETNVEGATLSWTSSNEDIITNSGEVLRPLDKDENVTLTLVVTINGESKDKKYIVKVIKAPQVDPEPTYFRVTFNTNGGSDIPAESIKEGMKINKPTDPTKDDHNFMGWYKESTFDTLWLFETDTLEADITLYAKWEEIIPDPVIYTVTFESNGGSDVANMEVIEGETFTKPTDPTKDDHNFMGWYKESTFDTLWVFETDTLEADITLYAKWEENVSLLLSHNYDLSDENKLPSAGNGADTTTKRTFTMKNEVDDDTYEFTRLKSFVTARSGHRGMQLLLSSGDKETVAEVASTFKVSALKKVELTIVNFGLDVQNNFANADAINIEVSEDGENWDIVKDLKPDWVNKGSDQLNTFEVSIPNAESKDLYVRLIIVGRDTAYSGNLRILLTNLKFFS